MKSMFQRTSRNTSYMYHKNKTLFRIAQPWSKLATLRGTKCFIFFNLFATNLNLPLSPLAFQISFLECQVMGSSCSL